VTVAATSTARAIAIDWSRVAAPQTDGYDRAAVRGAMRERWGWEPNRQLPDGLGSFGPGCGYSQATEVEILAVLAALDLWPDGRAMVASTVDVATYWRSTEPGGVGCSCGHWQPPETGGATVVFTTVGDPIGGAEGLVHEAGHLRLHALGVDLEAHDGRLLANAPDELHVSPIRKDKLRPMSAVLQAQYSYVWVTALDLAVGDAATEHLSVNLPRVITGRATIERGARWTPAGAEWWGGLCRWMDDVFEDGRRRLSA